MNEQDAALPQTLGARGSDIILLQHLKHGGPCYARDQRYIDATERNGGQDQVLQPRPETLGDRRVTLHGEPFELERKDIGQDISDHKDRQREGGNGKGHDDAVDQTPCFPGRDHAKRHLGNNMGVVCG